MPLCTARIAIILYCFAIILFIYTCVRRSLARSSGEALCRSRVVRTSATPLGCVSAPVRPRSVTCSLPNRPPPHSNTRAEPERAARYACISQTGFLFFRSQRSLSTQSAEQIQAQIGDAKRQHRLQIQSTERSVSLRLVAAPISSFYNLSVCSVDLLDTRLSRATEFLSLLSCIQKNRGKKIQNQRKHRWDSSE